MDWVNKKLPSIGILLPRFDKESKCPMFNNNRSSLGPPVWDQKIVTRYQFEKWDLDFDAIVPRLIEKNYIKNDLRVDQEFSGLDAEFRRWFPKYTKIKFNLIENILVSTKQTKLVQAWGSFLNRDWQRMIDATFANCRSATAAGDIMETMIQKYESDATYFCVAEPRKSRDYHLHVLIKGMSLVNILSLTYEWCWKYGRAEMKAYDELQGKRFYNSKCLGRSGIDFFTNIEKE